MSRFRHILVDRVWPWRWVALMNGYLLSPLVIQEIRLHASSDIPPALLLFSIAASVLWLLALQLTIRPLWLAHVLLFPFYVTVATDLFVISHYNTRLSSSTISIILENWGDAGEYLQSHWRSVTTTTLAVLLFYGSCLAGIWNQKHARMKYPTFAAWGGLVALYGVIRAVSPDWVHLAANDRSTPFGVVPQGYLASTVYRDVLNQAKRTQSFFFHTRREAPPEEPETYVLVIGESSRPDHWGIYGYGRQTTPQLSTEKNLLLFKDVIAQASYTKASVPLIITRGSAVDQDRPNREKSIVSAFKEAGFGTYWLSTQHRDPFTGAINRYSSEAESQRFVERQRDDALLPLARATISESDGKKRFIVVHTMGSHFTYTNRYPAEFSVFPDRDKKLSERELLVNSYDDTILYTDHILAQLIATLKETRGIKALFYTSDHGDNLKDDERGLFGHFLSNEYDLPIPMLFWFSDEYARKFPAKLEAARSTTNLRLSTRLVFYSVADCADLKFDDPNLATLSVFRTSFRPVPRIALKEPAPIDYDDWLVGQRAARAAR